jgi:hypothetical protein
VSDYSKSGVDLGKLRRYHEIAKAYFKAGEVGVGHYANAVKLGDYYLSIHVDGVVTKTLLALQTGIIEPVAQDCLAMNTNDLACVGSNPLIAVDYLALERPNDELVSRVMKGLKEAAERAEVLILGVKDVDEAYRKYRELGVKTLVYKMGSKGAVAVKEGEKVGVEAFNIVVEDPVGAGDAMAGTFVALYLKGYDIGRALKLASLSSALVVTVRSDNEIIPRLEKAERVLRELQGDPR